MTVWASGTLKPDLWVVNCLTVNGIMVNMASDTTKRRLKLAAKYHIMLDIHEPIKDCGLRRNLAKLMTREGARGAEWECLGSRRGKSARPQPTLVFTRLLAGPMD
jgi:hypothetical protein